MIAYVDSSVVLRLVLGQPGRLREWPQVERGAASALVEVECLRALDRLRLEGSLSDEIMARAREATFRLLESLEIVQITQAVLARAAQPMPVVIPTVDTIHLATALLWQEEAGADPVVATHDPALALASRAFGLRVAGVD